MGSKQAPFFYFFYFLNEKQFSEYTNEKQKNNLLHLHKRETGYSESPGRIGIGSTPWVVCICVLV